MAKNITIPSTKDGCLERLYQVDMVIGILPDPGSANWEAAMLIHCLVGSFGMTHQEIADEVKRRYARAAVRAKRRNA